MSEWQRPADVTAADLARWEARMATAEKCGAGIRFRDVPEGARLLCMACGLPRLEGISEADRREFCRIVLTTLRRVERELGSD